MSFKLFINPLNSDVKEYFEHKRITDNQHNGDSGIDLVIPKDISIEPHKTKLVNLGMKAAMYEYNSNWMYLVACFLFCMVLTKGNLLMSSLIILPLLLNADFMPYKNVSWWLHPRSSISKTPLILHNSSGLIDKGYRGELLAAFHNISNEPYTITAGTRLVQAVSSNISQPITFGLTKTLDFTTRGEGGFGSTGA